MNIYKTFLTCVFVFYAALLAGGAVAVLSSCCKAEGVQEEVQPEKPCDLKLVKKFICSPDECYSIHIIRALRRDGNKTVLVTSKNYVNARLDYSMDCVLLVLRGAEVTDD